MPRCDSRLEPGLVGAGRIVPVAGLAGSRATGTGPMAKSLFEEFDPWAFVIDRRRRLAMAKRMC
jgi:hypothetical protein